MFIFHFQSHILPTLLVLILNQYKNINMFLISFTKYFPDCAIVSHFADC